MAVVFRTALSLLAALLFLAAPDALAQAAASRHRVAYLTTLPEDRAASRLQAIQKRITERWPAAQVEYRVFRFEVPPSQDAAPVQARNDERLKQMLAWSPHVIFAPAAIPAKAAARVTSTIPIVFGCDCNPLADGWGLVQDPGRPERNLTGFTRYHLDTLADDPARRLNLHRKRIELLRKASARPVRRIGAIYGDDFDEKKWRYDEAARELGVEWVKVKLTAQSIDRLPAQLRERGVDAALVLVDTFLSTHRPQLVKAAAQVPFPVIFPFDEADLGAWMHYGPVIDLPDKAAEYIVNILRGRRVAEYPVEFPKQLELAVNFRTAKSHHWEFPRDFLLLVDRAIE